MKHVTYIRPGKKPQPYYMTELTNRIEMEPAANNTGNQTLSAISVIHGAEHTCGEGKQIVPVQTSQGVRGDAQRSSSEC